MQLPPLGPLTVLFLRVFVVLGGAFAVAGPLALVTVARLRIGRFLPAPFRGWVLGGAGGAVFAGGGLPLAWLCVRTEWPTLLGSAPLVVGLSAFGYATYRVALGAPNDG